jgi:ABC-type phosphate/phosphonate transport system substrate-binding protein
MNRSPCADLRWLLALVGGVLTRVGLLHLLCLLLLAWLPVSAQAPARPTLLLQIGFSRASFLESNPRDVESSFKALVGAISRKHGYETKAELHIYDTSADFEAGMKRGEVQLAAVGAWEYSGMDIAAFMEPSFVQVEQDRVMKEYLLLTRRDSGLNSVRDLKGKDAVVLESTVCLLASPWLDVLLAEEDLGTQESFFRRVEVTRKPTSAVLPVFFGNRQACVVDRIGFQVMAEMNPQVGSTLQAVASSPPYVSSILCLSRKGWPSEQYREDLLAALRDLHLEPEGRQILMLFKIHRLEPFKESYLGSLKELRAKYKRILPKPRP